MPPPRQVVDYSLQRRTLLREFYAGRVGADELCDASPYLKSAARFHGDQTDQRCPVCRRENLTHVHYVYGSQLRQSGQAWHAAELPRLATSAGEFQVFVVEVCRGCGWNHLVQRYLSGRDAPAAPSGARVAAGGRHAGLAAAGDSGADPPAAAGRGTRPVAPGGRGGVITATRRRRGTSP